MKYKLQRMIQISLLVLFIFLMVQGKVQLWLGLLIAGIVGSFLLGRFYCGWMCSINTVLTGIAWVKRKLKIKSIPVPKFLENNIIRYGILLAFIGVFAFSMTSGKKLPVLPALFAIGIFITLLFSEEFWHRYLCPYGTILYNSSRPSIKGLKIDPNSCNNCRACVRVCPAKAVWKTRQKHEISKSNCLVCMNCEKYCRQKAISYK